MKRLTILALLMFSCLGLFAQEWDIPVTGEHSFKFWDMITVDEGESVLGIGCIRTEDGYIAKATKEGEYIFREVHLPGMMLQYYTAVQLDNGNYMVFGVCDDSLCDYHKQKYLRIDVLDNQLNLISNRQYCVEDEDFEYFYEPWDGKNMRSIVSKDKTVIVATRLSFYKETAYGNYHDNAVRFYEFDDLGNTIRIVDNPKPVAELGSIKEITYEPHSDYLMMIEKGGNYDYDAGGPGVFVMDADLNIVARQSMLHLGGANITNNTCEGKWIDGDRLLVSCEQYIGSNFTFHTLYVVDSALNVYADLRLPPYDSCTWVPYGTSTAYINDSTIFAISYSSERMFSDDVLQVNLTLVDKHLNLLGRKVLKRDNVMCLASSPAAFNDGGCAVLITSYNGENYQGPEFREYNLMKFRREDIEITWDVVNETEAKPKNVAYPNPVANSINIPINETISNDARIQIFDAKGSKCLDSEVGNIGNMITLEVLNLDAGLYVYKVVSGKREVTIGKFIKE
jgi:hypothetical protein